MKDSPFTTAQRYENYLNRGMKRQNFCLTQELNQKIESKVNNLKITKTAYFERLVKVDLGIDAGKHED